MKRYPHYLYPAKGGRWPGQVAVVAVSGAWQDETSAQSVRHENLVSWHVCCLRKRSGRYWIAATYAGVQPREFWRIVYDYAQHGGSTWLFSDQCPRVWALLRLWQEIESERLRLFGNDPGRDYVDSDQLSGVRSRASLPPTGAGAEPVPGVRGQPPGYLVLEDPPCIARLGVAGQPGWFQWVDSRNYGVDPARTAAQPAEQARELAEWFMAFHQAAKTYYLGSLQATAGSQAMHAFRNYYLKDTIYVHCERATLELEGRAYYGGRAEAFGIGHIDTPLYHVDFRAQYGAVCADTQLPVRLGAYHSSGGGPEADRALRSGAAIADVTVCTEEPAYPLERDGVVIWPVGTFRTVLAGPELDDALHLRRVRSCHAVAEYELEPALAHYAQALYRLRCQAEASGNAAIASLAKRLLVSLPGKLGQRSRYWENAPDVWLDEPYAEWWGKNEAQEWNRYRSIAWTVHREVCAGWAADSVPAVAAWITSEARMRLLRAIRIAGWQHVFYCDTDSLFLDQIGYDRLAVADSAVSAGLGELYRKGGPHRVEIRGVKYYVEDDSVTCAGLPAGQYADAGDGRHYWYRQSPARSVKGRERPGTESVLLSYGRADSYRHGIVGPDGRVTPIRLEE